MSVYRRLTRTNCIVDAYEMELNENTGVSKLASEPFVKGVFMSIEDSTAALGGVSQFSVPDFARSYPWTGTTSRLDWLDDDGNLLLKSGVILKMTHRRHVVTRGLLILPDEKQHVYSVQYVWEFEDKNGTVILGLSRQEGHSSD